MEKHEYKPQVPEHTAQPGDNERLSFAAEVFRNIYRYDSYTIDQQMQSIKAMELNPASFINAVNGMRPEDYEEYQNILKTVIQPAIEGKETS